MKKEKMFIHAFNIGANCYIYDVNTDKILEVGPMSRFSTS